MKSIDLTAIIQAILTLMSTVITIYILPKVKSYLAEKLSNEQRENLKQWVKVAVAAAEQIYNKKGLGTDKYRYVVDFLKGKGIYVNSDEVMALIESEVYKLSQECKNVSLDVGTPHSEGTGTEGCCTYGEYLDKCSDDGNVPIEDPDNCDNDSPASDEENEPDTADEECESDTAEADNLFSARNTCE